LVPSPGDEELHGDARAAGDSSGPPPIPPGFWAHEPLVRERRAVPSTRHDAGAWVLFAVGGFLVGQIVALLVVAVAAGVTGNTGRLSAIENMAAPPAWYVGAGLVGLWVGFFVGPAVASRYRGTSHLLSDFGVAFKPVDVFGVLIGLGGQALITVIYLPFISHLRNFQAPTTKLTGGAHGASFAVIAVLTVLGAPFFEELFFRGLLFRGLLGFFGATGPRLREGRPALIVVIPAVLVDGLLFGAAHAELEQLAGLAVFGCILAVVALRTGRLGMNIVAHGTFNLVAVIAIVSSRSGVH
jgi:CAAX protease family protein